MTNAYGGSVTPFCRKLRCSGAGAELKLKEEWFPAGTYVVRLDQPYRNYAVDLLSPQHYPKDAGEPYDDISWSFPAHYHLNAIPICRSGCAGR